MLSLVQSSKKMTKMYEIIILLVLALNLAIISLSFKM